MNHNNTDSWHRSWNYGGNVKAKFCLKYCKYHEQPTRGVFLKSCSKNMQQIYSRTLMPKCDFNKIVKQLYWNHTSAWVLYCKFAAYFQDTFSTPLVGCFWSMFCTWQYICYSYPSSKAFLQTRRTSKIKHFGRMFAAESRKQFLQKVSS